MEKFTYVVPPAFDGQTVQNFLRQGCGLSWRMVVKLKRVDNGITVDGVQRRTIDRVTAGQTVVLHMPTDAVKIESMPMPIKVAYEDDYMLVVDKPPYLAVHPSAGKTDPTLANGIVAFFEARGENLSFRPVSRLDRNTSGLLTIAKSSHLAFALTGKIQKTYIAVVCGKLEGRGTIEQPIRIKEGCCITREVGDGGKPSCTHWRALGTNGAFSVVALQLETGRTHQIRVHMSWMGYPLVGDTMYGTDETLPRQALHCARLEFIHPITGEGMHIEQPLPQDMAALAVEILGDDYDDKSLCF